METDVPYDRYGNRNFDTSQTTTIPAGCAAVVCNPTVDPATNRLIGYTFDNAGNTKIDANGRQFNYDAENKQTLVKDGYGIPIGEYFYDGDGKRVKKVVGTEVTIFVYDASGKMVAEYSTSVAPVSEAKISYLTTDHLGSPRINTDANGQVTARHDYLPFGEEIARASYGNDDVRKQFTSYERDNETNLDYAINRYHSSTQGRFTCPDPYNIILEKEKGRNTQEKLSILITYISDPQIWNKYSYAVNNPLKHTDPDGRRPITAADRARVDNFIAWGNARADQIAASGDSGAAEKFRQAVQRAAAGVYQAIQAVQGQNDPRNLRALWNAIDRLGDQAFAQRADADGNIQNANGGEKKINSNGWRIYTGPNDNKCNIFVAAVYALDGGANIGLQSSDTPNGFPVNAKWLSLLRPGANGNLPTTSEIFASGLSNFNSTNSPSPGDIVTNGRHAGIWVGHEIVISATDRNGVNAGPMGTTLAPNDGPYKYLTYGKP